jgi:hypothetical protein
LRSARKATIESDSSATEAKLFSVRGPWMRLWLPPDPTEEHFPKTPYRSPPCAPRSGPGRASPLNMPMSKDSLPSVSFGQFNSAASTRLASCRLGANCAPRSAPSGQTEFGQPRPSTATRRDFLRDFQLSRRTAPQRHDAPERNLTARRATISAQHGGRRMVAYIGLHPQKDAK